VRAEGPRQVGVVGRVQAAATTTIGSRGRDVGQLEREVESQVETGGGMRTVRSHVGCWKRAWTALAHHLETAR
jgi:hypothetical protein